ncbi:MAG: hypothetical protein ACI943_001410 [Gammaproteobacteria bacterium]|jgi:hypothetical protein
MTKLYSLSFALMCACTSLLQGQISINEFMAANSSAVYDPDFDDSSDWIELYNNSAVSVDLSGYYLTDNLSDTTKWIVPVATAIEAFGFYVFWADGLDTGNHSIFKLSSIGEEIGLYNTSEELVDGFVYAAQTTDVSYGKTTDGGADWSFFQEPTPGASNNTSMPYEGITFFEPSFSTQGGFYSATQMIELSTMGGVIRYTLDGREPSLSDPIYTAPIAVESTSFIRARVFEDNFVNGPTITNTYFFGEGFEDRPMAVISLVTDPDYFYDPEIGLYVQDFKPEWENPLNVEFFENDQTNQAVFNERAGVKVNGQNSWVLPQKMLGIYFRNEYGSGNLDYPLFDDRSRNSFDDFILRAGGSDWAYTLFRDALCQDLPQEITPLGHQGFRHSIVYINGEYMGIHNVRSRLNGDFVEENYGMASGTYDLIENDGEVDEGSDDQFDFMDDLFNEDLTIEANLLALDSVVDLENFADYWITEMWCSNQSWGHNVKLWKPLDGGKWKFLLGDLDRGFTGPDSDDIASFTTPSEFGTAPSDFAKFWLMNIFENEEWAAYYAQRFNDHIYTTFHPDRVVHFIDKFSNAIENEMTFHAERWAGTTSSYGDGIVSPEFWQEEVAALHSFAQSRPGFMMADLQSTFGMSAISNLGVSNLPSQAGDVNINDFKVPDSPWSGPYFNDQAFQFTAIPNPGYQFVGWALAESEDLFTTNETWSYLDSGEDAGTAWRDLSFDNSLWSAGDAELGYGDDDESTTVSYGSDANNKYFTTYFRKVFDFSGTAGMNDLLLNLKRDDGAVIYLNGVEIARSNMPTGTVDYLTPAIEAIAGDDEVAFLQFSLQHELLLGTNVIAVEIHQQNATSSDISFDASLAVIVPGTDIFSSDATIDITLSGDASYVAMYEETGACLLPPMILENTTLTIDCSPYMTSGDTYVVEDVTLTVDPGVEIWFPETARLIVQGDLQVNGIDGQKVIFRPNADYGAASWGNVSFENTTAESNLSYLEIIGATKGEHPINNNAAISAWYSDLNMDHMTLLDNFGNPVFAQYSAISLTNSELHSEITGDLINVKYGDAYISDCIFLGNDQPDTDAIDYDEVIDGVIQNTRIEGFYGFNSDGIDLGEECQNILVSNCFIYDCTDKGISIGQSSTAQIENNTIVNCNQGIGIKDLGEASIAQTTFYSNVTGLSCFEKNPGSGGGIASITNSIISNSSLTPVFFDEMSSLESSFCHYDTDTMAGNQVFWADPKFINPTQFDFQLVNSSPSLFAGSEGQNLGTNYHLYEANSKVMISDIQYFHTVNPEQEFIKLLNASNETIDLSGFTIQSSINHAFAEGVFIEPGEKIMLVKDILLFPSETGQVYQWDTGQLSNGGELLLVVDAYGIVQDHVDYRPDAPWLPIALENEHLTLISSDLDNHFASSWILEIPPVSVEDIAAEEFVLYPNPSTGIVHLRNLSSSESMFVEILDMQGRVVYLHSVNTGGATTLDTGLKNGIYLLNVWSDDIVIGTRKLLIH